MNNFNMVIIYSISIISGISTVLLVLEALGFLPEFISKYLIKNKLGLTKKVLEELGINTVKLRKSIITCLTSESKKNLKEKLSKFTYDIEVEIGETSRGCYFDKYIDLMGATTNETNARDFAGRLKSFVENNTNINLDDIDLVATSKLGSPILGYEFSKNIEKPLILHSLEEKFRTNSDKYSLEEKFDTGGCLDLKGKRALIVEDSTTGGRKILKMVEDLRKNKIEVKDCLVVFAPQGKNAKEKLQKRGITLYELLKTHQKEMKIDET